MQFGSVILTGAESCKFCRKNVVKFELFYCAEKNGVGGAVKEMQSQITVIQRLDKEDPGNF